MINTIPALIGLAQALFDGYNWCGDLAPRKFSVAGERETPRDALVTAILGSEWQASVNRDLSSFRFRQRVCSMGGEGGALWSAHLS